MQNTGQQLAWSYIGMVVVAYLDEIIFLQNFYKFLLHFYKNWSKTSLSMLKNKFIISSRKNSKLFMWYSIDLPSRDESNS